MADRSGKTAFEPNRLRANLTRTPAPRLRAETGHQRLSNAALALVLVLIVLAAPLPVASNRGFVWMFWAMLIAASAASYLFLSLLGGNRIRTEGVPRYSFWLVGAFIIYGLVQLAPLAPLLPDWAVALPLTSGELPAAISLAPAATMTATLRFASMAVFLILFLAVTGSRSRSHRIAWVLFFSVLVYALWALVSLRYLGDDFFWGEKIHYKGFATGPFINRNSFATFLGMGAVLGLSLGLHLLRAPGSDARPLRSLLGAKGVAVALSLVCVAIIAIALLATQSRMGVAATLVALGVVWFLSSAPARSRAVVWLSIAGATLIAVLALVTQGADLVDRLIIAVNDFGGRRDLYRQVWQMILARPLGGYGLDTFPAAFELFHRPPVSPEQIWDNSHSTYLTLWVEMGLLIGSIPPFVALMLGLRLWRNLVNGQADRALAVAAIGCLFLIGLHATVDFGIEMQANQFLALAILALGLRRG